MSRISVPIFLAASLIGEPTVAHEFGPNEAPPRKDQGGKIDPVKTFCFDPVLNAKMYFSVALIHAGNGERGNQKNRDLQCSEARRHFDFARGQMKRENECCPGQEKLGNKALIEQVRKAVAMRAKAEAKIKRNCPRSI